MASTNPRRRRSASNDNPAPADGDTAETAGARPVPPSPPADDPPAPTSIINAGDCCMVRVRVNVVEYGPDGTELARRREPLVSVEIDVAVHHRTLPR